MALLLPFALMVVFLTMCTRSANVKCKNITLVPKFKDSDMPGTWYLTKASKNRGLSCLVIHCRQVGPRSFKSTAKALNKDEKEIDLSIEFGIQDSVNPDGIVLNTTGIFPIPADMYVLDATPEGFFVSLSCFDNGNGKEEVIQVMQRGSKTIDEDRLKEVLAKNNLDKVPMKYTFVNCPENIENF